MTFEKNRTPPQCYFKLCASFRSHMWIQTWVTVRKQSIQEIWQMTMKNSRACLLSYFKLIASFHSHPWIQTRVKVQKCPNCFNLCDLDLWYLTYQLVSPKPLTRPFVLKYVKLLGLPTRLHSHHSRLPGESHMSEHPLFSPVVSQWLCNQMQSAWDVAAVRLLTF